MKSLEYVKAFMEEKIKAFEQVENNPEMYDKATLQYAKVMKEDAEKWYKETLEKQNNGN